jgi:uncharacterized protein
MTPELADRILAGILELEGTDSAGTHREFTFFGGEPLAAANKPLIEYIVRRASEMGPAAFGAVTNGTDLDAYVDLLGPSRISSLQVTLDGPPTRTIVSGFTRTVKVLSRESPQIYHSHSIAPPP